MGDVLNHKCRESLLSLQQFHGLIENHDISITNLNVGKVNLQLSTICAM